MKGRRIIFVLGNLELGGAERQALILARFLSQQEQAQVEVWGFNKSGPVAEICDQHAIPWRVIPCAFGRDCSRGLSDLRAVARALRQAQPDILLPYTFLPNLVCGLVWKRTGARACVWNQRDEGLVPFASTAIHRAVKRTSHFISNSEAGARFLIDKLNVDEAKVTIIPNGVETVAAVSDRRAWRERLSVNDQAFVACMVANLHLNKDHDTVLRAWRKVVDELDATNRSALLVLAGRHDGAYESLTTLARELQLNDNVCFTGPISDVAGLLSAADVSVFSSRSEGCPNVVLESMAAGLPVAGTDIKGIRDVVGTVGAQFLAPVGDADSLAKVLLKMARSSLMCERAGDYNRFRVQQNYDALRMCRETVKLLAQLY